MSRTSLSFLRPYLYRASAPAKPEYARAYVSIQRRFAQTVVAENFTGPHDVEKQKRLEQLKRAKPLGDYHPRLAYPTGAESLPLRDFHAKYQSIQETNADVVSVFGMLRRLSERERWSNIGRKGAISSAAWLQADVP